MVVEFTVVVGVAVELLVVFVFVDVVVPEGVVVVVFVVVVVVVFDVVQSASTQEVDDGQEEQKAPYGVILSQKEMKIKDKNLRIHRSPNEVSADGIVADQKIAIRHGRLGRPLQSKVKKIITRQIINNKLTLK